MDKCICDSWHTKTGECTECGTHYTDRIFELQAALREIEETVDNWRWGWDGDCGISEKIGVMVDKALSSEDNQ